MADALNIRIVCGWSVWLREVNDPLLPWQATATKDKEHFGGSGLDRHMALARVAHKCGFEKWEAFAVFEI